MKNSNTLSASKLTHLKFEEMGYAASRDFRLKEKQSLKKKISPEKVQEI